MTVIGNVLGSTSNAALGLPADLGTTSTGAGAAPATTRAYTSADGSTPAIFLIDTTAVPYTSLCLHGNFDTVNEKVMWNASTLTANLPPSTQSLPASLYYRKKPGWWPSAMPWPWASRPASARRRHGRARLR